MATQSQKNSIDIIKLQGETKLINQKLETITNNHLHHLDLEIKNIKKNCMGNSNHKSKQSIKPGGKLTKLNTHIKGTIGEYQEIVNLTKAGWHISKSCDPQCPFDLVAVSYDGQTIRLIDVKTNTYRTKRNKDGTIQRIGRSKTKLQKQMGIELLMVDHGN